MKGWAILMAKYDKFLTDTILDLLRADEDEQLTTLDNGTLVTNVQDILDRGYREWNGPDDDARAELFGRCVVNVLIDDVAEVTLRKALPVFVETWLYDRVSTVTMNVDSQIDQLLTDHVNWRRIVGTLYPGMSLFTSVDYGQEYDVIGGSNVDGETLSGFAARSLDLGVLLFSPRVSANCGGVA